MKNRRLAFFAFLTLFTAIVGVPSSARSASALSSEPLVVPKEASVISTETRAILESQKSDVAKVWVFFTDKGVTNGREFQQAAAQVALSDRALTRRSKMGLDRVLFVDLPVASTYVDQIERLGGKLRRESRYLNAASFELPTGLLDQIAALPYVSQIRPVAEYVRPNDPEEAESEPRQTEPLQSAVSLGYGSSITQLNLMKVPAMHAKGYTGQGITLAVFDTGFRKSHQAFTAAYSENRVLAEYDFVFNDNNTANEAADASGQWSHGTSTWSLAGGLYDGKLYGPAYKANFILAKTEDIRSETHVEEDNWVRAVEWADSIGVDVITSSLGYRTFDAGQTNYTYADLDGRSAVITKAANMADSLGIVVCNSMGNDGPNSGTLSAPADALDIIAVGAVYSTGSIAGFSSRGPTYDGRTKPEVCAMGVNTYVASSTGDAVYSSSFSGTSAACPLAAGAACLLVQARPTFPPSLIRQALMATASQASTPDNTYGSGIINLEAAIAWGAGFAADKVLGTAPMDVQFTDLSPVPATSRVWDFGDGTSSTEQNPVHHYANAGHFTVKLTNQTPYGQLVAQKTDYVVTLADTLWFGVDSVFAGHQGVKSVYLTNSLPVQSIYLPFAVAAWPLRIAIDSITKGTRTDYFDLLEFPVYDSANTRFVVHLLANWGSSTPPLDPGTGEILKIYWTTSRYDLGGQGNALDTLTLASTSLKVTSPVVTYLPVVIPGVMATKTILRSDYNRSFLVDLSDLTAMVAYLTGDGQPPITVQAGDFNGDSLVDLTDLTGLVSYLTGGGAQPANP